MPKGKRKGRSDRRNEFAFNSSDDESINDNVSVVSNVSENRSAEDCEDADDLAQEQIEEKLCEHIDGLTQKSSQGRINCFQTLTKAFIKKCMPGFIRERYFTICDSIERSLKKGGGSEKTAAAELATVMGVQLGGEDASEEIYRLLKPVLLTIVLDNSVAASVRAMCCTALGNITFLSGSDIGDILILMQQLESIFSASYLKGDKTIPNITAETATLHASAISTWSLLFTVIPPGNIGTMINNSKSLPSLGKLSELLESLHLEIRMAVGEALALIFELGREESDVFEDDFALDITETLKQLATDSHKYRAKKDRKQQRASFRDILQFIENDTVPEVQVKFGKEVLILDTWTRRKQYESLCNILGPSINIHLTENDLLRDIFEIMVPPPSAEIPAHAQHQMERFRKRLLNAANFKARTLSRAKNRDKRSDF
ncbi:hypothetical protein JTB14_011001 [Gonioctena quinquepunctata]|nr:hypothetical protein JTB14_011001 [Gonioctena quinquepunctata]